MNEKLHAALVLIARQPTIRTVEIADKIDMDTDLVQPMLQGQIDNGNLIVIPVTAPNGQPANGFMFAEKFRKTDEFRAWFNFRRPVAPIEPEDEPAQEVPEPEPSAAAEKTESASVLDGNRVDMAIRFIRQNGSATRGEISKLLGLKKGQYPRDYLGRAVSEQRLSLHRGVYTLGPAIPDKFTQQAVATKDKTRPDPVFRCAMWSDGALELQRNGITIAILSDAEQATIMNFRRNVIAAVNGEAA